MIDCGCDEILLPQGSDGVNGKNAFTVTTASFVQPAALSNVTITVSDSLQNTNQWAIPGQIIRVTDASGNGGWYQVVSITGTTQILVTNLDYTGSSTAGLTIATGAGVSPAGLQGPQGDPGTQGGQGNDGPANTLSIAATNTLQPGTSAYVLIGGTAPNQTLTFGIPEGLPGAGGKVLYSDYVAGPSYSTISNYDSFIISGTLPAFQTLLSSPLTVNAGDLCPANGDFAIINVSARLNVGVNPKSFFLTAWRFKINNVVIGLDPSDSPTSNAFDPVPLVPIVFLNMIKENNIGIRHIELQLIIYRVSSTTAKIYCKGISGGINDTQLDMFFPRTPFFKSNITGVNFSNTSLPIDIEGAMMTNSALTTESATIRIEGITIQTLRQS